MITQKYICKGNHFLAIKRIYIKEKTIIYTSKKAQKLQYNNKLLLVRVNMYKEVESLITNAIENRIFSGGSVGFYSGKVNRSETESFGHTDQEQKREVTDNTFFDLASLTKPLVTVLCVATLIEKGLLDFSTNIQEIFKERTVKNKKITIADMLSHSAGFVAHKKYYEEIKENYKENILHDILTQELSYKTGSSFIYSDIGYILLGYIVEKISGKSLDFFWYHEICKKMNVSEEFYFSGSKKLSSENCVCTKNLFHPEVVHCGVVHDDNCRVMGGTTGHAGLFGTVTGVLKICEKLIRCYSGEEKLPFCRKETLHKFFQQSEVSSWAKGFDTPSKMYSTAGHYFSEKTVGHLGFTGTSFWLDLERNVAVVLLTNRAYYADSLLKMKQFRPHFHDTVMKKILDL